MKIAFVHRTDLEKSLPFLGLSAVDLDGDGVDEIFVGGGRGQADDLFRFNGQAFDSIAATSFPRKDPLDATFGAASIDCNSDGFDDLFIARESGVYYFENDGAGALQGRLIEFELEENTVPLSIALGDVNRDGFVDLYVSNVGRTLPEFMLRGNLAADAPFNMDYMLLENQSGFQFEDIAARSNAAAYGFGWGTDITDFNNDGRMDLYFARRPLLRSDQRAVLRLRKFDRSRSRGCLSARRRSIELRRSGARQHSVGRSVRVLSR